MEEHIFSQALEKTINYLNTYYEYNDQNKL